MESPAQVTAKQLVTARVFISYKRDSEPDVMLVQHVMKELEANGHNVFVDTALLPGEPWPKELERRIREADVLFVFISSASIRSEMVRAEIEIARDQAGKSGGKPSIVPIRVIYAGTLPYPLNAYLGALQFAIWRGESDTEPLVKILLRTIARGPNPRDITANAGADADVTSDAPSPAYAAHLPPPGETLDVEDPWYIFRTTDETAITLARQIGRTMTIKAPRQMGKSSLLMRIVSVALQLGKRPALLDFQLLDRAARESGPQCYRTFAAWTAEQLELPHAVDQFWDEDLPDPYNCTKFFETQVLAKLQEPVLLAIDQADALFESAFRSDFFGMIRTWHNNRSSVLKKAWKRLDLVLVTSTDPTHFITRPEQSPFNVGEVLRLVDFSAEQVRELNLRHGSPLFEPEVRELTDLLGGHPYLVRRALYSITAGRPTLTPRELFASAADDGGPFSDHLESQLLWLHRTPVLIPPMLEVLSGRGHSDQLIVHRLTGAGLVKRVGASIVPRCRLYADYLHRSLRR